MKFTIPDKVQIVIRITERIGIPTVLCLVFGYLYFMKLEKLLVDLTAIRGEINLSCERDRNDHEEIKREVRRLGWSGNSRRGQ